ncbi:Phospholipase C [Purpureocillium takamizusanense]|uniref:Phospholipase C n=1 Tax=Purpureocillium takamizusanense TaxID=2060973 RepID=A0A9Q8VB68_9HYPO|nr:Phospholipase C [Purpureocillium takamizusanense]UNI19383.1 Phospholipase C [Purpureocillium takamizusanense]
MWYSILSGFILASAATVQGGSLKDIKHIILFMQENRSFDHYFGTMPGTRNFGDPNVRTNEGVPVWKQKIKTPKNGVTSMTPWHINYLGGDWPEATQCMGGGSNGWEAMHGAWNSGKGDGWALYDTDYSMGYYTQSDVQTHWDIANGWTIMDNSHQSILGVTDPNRIMWMSGSVNTKGSPTNPNGEEGNILSNRASPGCDRPKVNCFPFVHKTVPEHLEEAGISWRVWQDFDNFEDNMLAYFKQYQDAPKGNVLRDNGISFPGLQAFYDACANGTLPQVSWIVGPAEQSEHAPNMPIDGAWLHKNIIDAVMHSPIYNETALIVSYDEQGGWADHVIPPVAPSDATGEWIEDPFNPANGVVPIGPGPRVPRFIVSPWTRGGHVFTETGDHTSDIMFIEAWAKANGYKMSATGITPWRRQHMTDMVNAFDFENPDYSLPHISSVRTPEPRPDNNWSGNLSLGSLSGPWVGPAKCQKGFAHGNYPSIPYGAKNLEQDMASLVENGYKLVRGAITEGRFVTIEGNGLALARNSEGKVLAVQKYEKHDEIKQRWILHSSDGNRFGNSYYLQSALDMMYIARGGGLTKDRNQAQEIIFTYSASGSVYTLSTKEGGHVGFTKTDGGNKKCRDVGKVYWNGEATKFQVFGVNYRS